MIAKHLAFRPNLIKRREFFTIFPISLLLHTRSASKLVPIRALSNILIFGMRIEEDSDEVEVNVLAGSRTRHLAARVVQTDLVPLCYLTKKQNLFFKSIITIY